KLNHFAKLAEVQLEVQVNFRVTPYSFYPHNNFFQLFIGVAHYISESLSLAAHRSLSISHPMMRLLLPHLFNTMAANKYGILFFMFLKTNSAMQLFITTQQN